MKRNLFVITLGLALLVCMTGTAMAETKLTFNGYYRVEYENHQNTMLLPADEANRNVFFQQRFRFQPSFIVSDNLRLNMRLRGDADTWGQNTHNGGSINIRRVWMDINLPGNIGLLQVGRMNDGVMPLELLGYGGSKFNNDFIYTGPFQTPTDQDKIQYTYTTPDGAFAITGGYVKRVERDADNSGRLSDRGISNANVGQDEDWEEFSLTPTYKWSTGGAAVVMTYSRDRSGGDGNSNSYALNTVGLTASGWDVDMFKFTAGVVQEFGPVAFHVAGAYYTGTAKPNKGLGYTVIDTQRPGDSLSLEFWGVYADMTYNFGPGVAALQFQYNQGDPDQDRINKYVSGAGGSGGDMYPFLVAQSIICQNTYGGQSVANAANYWMLAGWVDYNITDALMVHASLGYFGINNTPRNALTGDRVENDFGWEADLGVQYEVMPGLTFTTMFGYFLAGKYQEMGNDANDYGDAYAWKNQLKLSF